MGSTNEPSTQLVHSNGIYHGLPDLSHASKGMTAIVTGANGISGAHMVRVLSESPDRWSKIYALSRRAPSGSWPKTVEHIPVDFLSSPEDIAEILRKKKIKPDYVFFFSYVLVVDEDGALQWGDQRLVDKNTLPLASALPKRIFIQFGGKWYGVHLGQTPTPDEETDPRLDLEPNLYYTQHDTLAAFCNEHRIGWNTAYPSFVIGAALDSSQSLLFPLLVYASVQKYLNKPLVYPADLQAWYQPQSLSTAVLNSRFYEWAVLAPNTANQAFNASDDCAFTWGRAWPRLAARFGMEYQGPDTEAGAVFREKKMKASPPPHGRGEASVLRFRFSFVEWAQEKENLEAWKELVERFGLRDGEWRDVGSIFGRADFCLQRPFSNVLSATKAKKFGWFGFVDSYESILGVVEEFVRMRIIPDPSAITTRPR